MNRPDPEGLQNGFLFIPAPVLCGGFVIFCNSPPKEKVMSNRNRRYSKRELLGSLYVDYVMSVQDLGLSPNCSRWEILREFLRIGEARAERLIEEPGGFLFLQSVAGQPNSGGIYVYNESLKAFFWLQFEAKDGSLNGRDFDYAVRVYHLLKFTVNANRNSRPRKHHHRKSIPWRRQTVLPTVVTGDGHARMAIPVQLLESNNAPQPVAQH
jgi:hypothetical protein